VSKPAVLPHQPLAEPDVKLPMHKEDGHPLAYATKRGRIPGHIAFSKARELPADKVADPLVQDVKKALNIQLKVAYYVVSQVKYFHIFGDLLSQI
jgi:hypothetical protein